MDAKTGDLRRKAAGGTFCIIPYCHPDYSWTHHREWHEERYAVSFCDALDLMAQHPEFRFIAEPWIDHVVPFLQRCPDRVEELRDRLNSGQMGVKAFTLTSPRPTTCPDETFIRNMTIGRELYSDFAPEADLTVMACPDVGIGHSQMPQLVKLAGGLLYRGWRSDSALSAKGVPREFRWRGLDGTEMLTSRGTYGGLHTADSVPDDFRDRWEELVARLLEGEIGGAMDNSSAKTWWVPQGMDDARPLRGHPTDKPIPLMEFIAEWNAREQSKMVLCTPEEYRKRLQQERRVPLWDGVLDPVDVAYNSGWHGSRGLWRLRQELDGAMIVAERVFAQARLAGCEGIPGPGELRELWIETVRVSSHAQQWAFDKDWEWLIDGARRTLRRAKDETDAAITRLSGAGRQSGNRRPLVLYNPLPYEREEIVEVPWVQPRLDAPGYSVTDAAGKEAELQTGECSGECWGGSLVEAPLIFRATVPAMGYSVYTVGDGPAAAGTAPPEDGVLDNGALSIRVDGRGLQEVVDKASGTTWQAPRGSSIGDCRLFEMGPGVLHIGPITGELGAREGTGSWVCCGPIRWVYRWEADLHGHQVRQDIIIDRGARHIDLRTRVFCAGTNGFFALCFEPPVRGKLRTDIPFGVEPRELADEPYAHSMPPGYQNIERHREHQFWGRSFASLTDMTRGVSIITLDGDKYWTYDEASGTLRHILFTALQEARGYWEEWTTRDRLALGWHEFCHRIVLHDSGWRDADICGASDRARLPLRAVKPVGPAAPPAVPPGDQLAIWPPSVRLSAFYEVQEGYVLRVYESLGRPAEAAIMVPEGLANPIRTDLNLEPVVAAVELEGRALTLMLEPWQIATVLLTKA